MIVLIIKNFINSILSVIYPPFCRYCKSFLSEDAVFCEPCMQLIKPIATIDLSITKNFSCPVWAISSYQEPVRSLVLAKTYRDITAAVQLAKLMLDHTPLLAAHADLVIPIPLHWRRFAKRGYNQAHEMAKIIAQKKSIPCLNVLTRKRATSYQAHLSVHERIANVKDVFSARADLCHQITGKHLVLVDDLFTTGATITSAIKVLKKYSPASITVVVACRVA